MLSALDSVTFLLYPKIGYLGVTLFILSSGAIETGKEETQNVKCVSQLEIYKKANEYNLTLTIF